MVNTPREFYNNIGEQEHNRLSSNSPIHKQLEFERTVEYMSEYLPKNGHILDAGGATGRYSRWLLNNGYSVTLIDLSDNMVRIAKEKLKQDYQNVNISQQTITKIGFDDNVFDAIICTGGPLSHVMDHNKRVNTINEFKRISRKGSPIFISVMGLLNTLSQLVKIAPKHDETKILKEFAKTGEYTVEMMDKLDVDTQFTACKFFRTDELRKFLVQNNITVHDIIGLESITSSMSHYWTEEHTKEQENQIRDTVKILGNDDGIADMSAHILAICSNE